MKGLTHFMSGLAVSSFFAPAVAMAASSKIGTPEASASFILVLGGLFGIMPDTLDFKVGQFFAGADYDVDCDPINPDPQKMAEQIGRAMEEAYETGRYVKAQLYPMRVGAQLWRQYVVKFDGEKQEVNVVINEVVTTSQIPYLGTEPKENRVGRYRLKCKLLETHGRPSVVDILSGPQFGFRKVGDQVAVEFLPWHRTWSHSYILGLMLALPVWLIAYLGGFPYPWLYGLVSFLGFAVHITEDLTGHMGGSLLWPFLNKRFDGLLLFRASNPHANFTVDFACVSITLFNLDRFTTKLVPLTWAHYFLFFLVIPLAVYWLVAMIFGEKRGPKEGAVKAEAALSEAALRADLRNEEALFEDENVQ
jgi:membrane-bound metal-dependent hydrolase YbcI (DUF457 family)